MVLLLSDSLPNDKFLGKSKFKGSAEGNTNVTQKLKFILGRVENIVGKGENAGYQKTSYIGPLTIGVVW